MSLPHPSPPLQVTLLLAGVLTSMAFAPVSPGLPSLREHFAGVPDVDYLVRFAFAIPAATIALFSPLAGIIVDRIGRRRVLIAGTLAYGLFGSAALLVDSLTVIIVTRACLGAAVAFVMTAASTLSADYFSGAERQRFLGLRSGVVNFGSVVFNTIGGLLATLDWRAPFLCFLLAFALLPAMIRLVFEPALEQQRGAGGAPAAAEPVPYAFILGMYGVAVAYSLVFYLVPTQIPFYLREHGILSPSLAGLAIASCSLGISGLALLYGTLRRFLATEALAAVAFALVAAGFALVGLATTLGTIAAALFLGGCGLGIIFSNNMVWLVERCPAAVRGRVLGGHTTAVFFGHFISPLISQPLADVWGLSTTYIAAAGMMTAMALLFVTLHLRRPARRPAA